MPDMLRLTLGYLVLVLTGTGVGAGSLTDAKNLFTSIAASGYNTELRPLTNQSHTLEVQVEMLLISIKDFDEVSGTLRVLAIYIISWTDQSLIWNSATYNGLNKMVINNKNVWYPKLYNLKVSDAFAALVDKEVPVKITEHGGMTWTPGGLLDIKCNPDVSYFPFDTQTCIVQLTPWGYSATEISMVSSRSDFNMDYYETNGEWKVEKTAINSAILADFSTINFHITISRLPGFHLVNTILPLLVLLLMNPLVFLLPCESGERVGYSLTVFLTFTVFVTIISAVLPANSDKMSRLSYFVFGVLVTSGVIASINIFQLLMFHKDENTPVPRWLVRLVRIIGCRCKSSKGKVASATPKSKSIPSSQDKVFEKSKKTVAHVEQVEPAECDPEMTWQDVVRILDLVYICSFYIGIVICVSVIMISMATGKV